MNDKRILIVDDAVFMRKMIRNTLMEAGYTEFCEAANGDEAVKIYRENGAELVFMDVTMPGKDGLGALKEIMAFDPQAKVVMCSAIGQDGVIMEAIQSGACEFVVKPFRKEQLVEVAKSLIG